MIYYNFLLNVKQFIFMTYKNKHDDIELDGLTIAKHNNISF